MLGRADAEPDRSLLRPAGAEDLGPIAQLTLAARHQLISLGSDGLDELVGVAPGVLIGAGPRAQAALIGSPIRGGTIWIRLLAIASQLRVSAALALLLPAFHDAARAAGASACYYGGDESSEAWLATPLAAHGYQHNTDVLTYAKHDLRIPSEGSAQALVRDAAPADEGALWAIDQACFEPQWTKGATALRALLAEPEQVRVAELDGRPAGYTYATSYYSGRQLHLVRIAVAPAARGRGVGARLMADLVARARGRGASIITLNTQAYNTSARRLYEWFGFRLTGDYQRILRCPLARDP